MKIRKSAEKTKTTQTAPNKHTQKRERRANGEKKDKRTTSKIEWERQGRRT
jgi:hypothetical protein